MVAVIGSANVDEVMLEQLEALIEHCGGGYCGCSECDRYRRVRRILLEPFGQPDPPLVKKATA